MSTPQHPPPTPRPWRIGRRRLSYQGLDIKAGSELIATMYSGLLAEKANASLIVHAVNCHDALLEALRHTLIDLADLQDTLKSLGAETSADVDDTIRQAQETIDLASGVQQAASLGNGTK